MTRKSQDDHPILPPGKLTAVAVRNLTKPGLYADGLGLYLQISKWGTKSWIYRYMVNGRAHKLGLGPIYTVSLSEAREAALDARSGLRRGIDPIVERKAALGRLRLATAKAMTFKECAEAYIEANRAGWKNAKHATQWFSTFNETRRGKRVYPAATAVINDLPVDAIDTGLVIKTLEPIWATTTETASRIRGRIELVLDWAKVRGYRDGENPARWRGHLDKILPARAKVQRVEHHAALAYEDLPAFMAELRARQGVSARALEFTILTAARAGEVVGARWAELDLARKVWIVPGSRMKSGKEHSVPLSDRVLAILADLPRDGECVFPGGRAGRPVATTTMLAMLQGMRGKTATTHGFRSSFRDWAGNETNFPRELAEQALAHVIGDKAEQAYRRGDALERRRRLMDAWAGFCERPLAKGDNVVSMRESA